MSLLVMSVVTKALRLIFSMSLSDECFCPKCDSQFELLHEDGEDGDDDE